MTKPTLTYRLKLDVAAMQHNNLLQGAVFEPGDGKWYLTQAQDAGARDREHTYIRRFSKNGAYEGYMKLELWGHGNAIGVRKSAIGNVWIWCPMDHYDSRGNTIRTQVARAIWNKGKTYPRYEKSSGGTVDIFADDKGDNGLGLGLPGKPKHLHLRRGYTDHEIWRKVDEEEYVAKNGKAKVLAQIEAPKYPGKYFQGGTADGDLVAVLRGSTVYSNSSHYQHVNIYSFSKKKKIADLDIDYKMLKKCLGPHNGGDSSYECEGLHFIDKKLYMGCRSGPAGKKRSFCIMEVDW